ncbi:hypothetical protein E1B28_002290 [Marasmius oreades]|uniref:Uncharacterized protein n=1 Tax=Marasmius oreades TaxID=181124 RepID=A0A9P7UKF6_9AGAR|nr:uncharacterized protein E1B28_002290 [Marasmius oreades]KAG7086327.1 hypothetical protein E1B28_002290 [Marasmius oreades]
MWICESFIALPTSWFRIYVCYCIFASSGIARTPTNPFYAEKNTSSTSSICSKRITNAFNARKKNRKSESLLLIYSSNTLILGFQESNHQSSGSPFVGHRKPASFKENNSIGSHANILGRHLPKKPSLDDDGEDQSRKLRRSSGRIVSAGGGASPSFLEALRRSSTGSSTSLDDPPNAETELPFSDDVQETLSTTVPASLLAFTLDLSPIMEDLHIFTTDGLGPVLPSLPSLATVGTDSTGSGYMHGTGAIAGILGVREEEKETAREEEVCDIPIGEDSEPETHVYPGAQPSLDTVRKPSLVLQHASVTFSDGDQSLAQLPALTLTQPTPELGSKPVFEAMNPLLPSISECGLGNAMQEEIPAEHRPVLKPTLAADQSVSSLSLPLALQANSVPISPSSSQYLQLPSPLATRAMSIPTFPRCTSCGFGFGSGFDVASSSDMLNVSRIPCGRCEEQWSKCVQWYAGYGDAKPHERLNRGNKRFSWLLSRKKEDATPSTNKKKRRSLFILPGVAKRMSIAMPTVTTQIITTDEVGVEADDLRRRKVYRK